MNGIRFTPMKYEAKKGGAAVDWAVELGMTVIYIKHNNLSPGTAPTEAKRRHRRAAQRKTHFVRCAARARSKIAIYVPRTEPELLRLSL